MPSQPRGSPRAGRKALTARPGPENPILQAVDGLLHLLETNLNAQQSKQLKGTTGWTVRKFASTKYLQYNIAKDKYLANANLRKAISLSKTTGSTAVRWKAMVAAERALLEEQGVTPLYYTNEATLVKTSVKGVVFNGAGSPYNFKEAYIK